MTAPTITATASGISAVSALAAAPPTFAAASVPTPPPISVAVAPAPATAPVPPTPVSPTAAQTAKAKPGELRATVAGVLAADSTADFSVTELVSALGNSGGAIGNACETLVARGEADRVGAKPRRYKANAQTAAAAAKAVITSPGQGLPPRTAGLSGTTASTTPPATTPPPRKRSPAKTGPITRPNGQLYYPRTLAPGISDVDALHRLRDAGIPALLYGPPGTGKTSMAEAAFDDLITIAGDGDTTVGDLIGDWTQKDDGGYEFIYGPVIEAMLEGRPLLIDDATLISPKVLAAMYPAMDGRKQIIVKAHKGEVITADDGFYVIAGHNPGVHGAILTEALSSRFSTQIHVETDYDLCQQLGIDPKAVTIARGLAKLAANGEVGWAPQLRELIAFQRIADTIGPEVAFANLIGIAPIEDRDQVADLVAKTFKKVKPLALGKQI
ncbi:AAA family ATPase [Catenulispora rubra]|uniref:AAA family ATPase n=1 Tax=Catenulispora rubra TaxID=280293 RepID=UPI00189249C9|nr:AAA family ATPase [Catenulispora rubra]